MAWDVDERARIEVRRQDDWVTGTWAEPERRVLGTRVSVSTGLTRQRVMVRDPGTQFATIWDEDRDAMGAWQGATPVGMCLWGEVGAERYARDFERGVTTLAPGPQPERTAPDDGGHLPTQQHRLELWLARSDRSSEVRTTWCDGEGSSPTTRAPDYIPPAVAMRRAAQPRKHIVPTDLHIPGEWD